MHVHRQSHCTKRSTRHRAPGPVQPASGAGEAGRIAEPVPSGTGMTSRADVRPTRSLPPAWHQGRGRCRRRGSLSPLRPPRTTKGKEKTPFPFQRIAHGGTCGKTRVAPQNRRLRPGPAETDRGSAALVSADIAIRSHEPQIGADDVNPMTTSAFDLPDHLAAKAAPTLIAGDEQHFAAIAESLERSIADLSDRLDAERKAPGGTGQEAMDRDMEIHRLTARLRVLRRFGLDLCLGHRVRAGDSEPVYVGRLGLTDSAGGRLLLDWRPPAAEPFFGATHANPMGLASRRRYRWTRGRIRDYWDEVFTAAELAGHAALDDQSAFLASLGGARSGRMRDVLGTIQADQDAIIRASSRGALVVDGGPGTGKTVVALHRAAYLLYADPRLGRRTGQHSG